MEKNRMKAAFAYAGKTQKQLAQELGMCNQNFQNRLTKESFRENEIKEIAGLIGAKFVCYIEFPDGRKF